VRVSACRRGGAFCVSLEITSDRLTVPRGRGPRLAGRNHPHHNQSRLRRQDRFAKPLTYAGSNFLAVTRRRLAAGREMR
jgi:hypothetical protein